MKKIGVLTSGGDAPGMNAAICAVVERGYSRGIEVYGIVGGYKGMVEGDFELLTPKNTFMEKKRGGTMLFSARYPEFKEVEYQKKGIEVMKNEGIEGLVVIGGNGSLAGALSLTELGYPAIGIPATIDNDIPGTEYTIGFGTAVNNALGALDSVVDTAASHGRTIIVEVMGRDSGDIALWSGLASGADAILVPEQPYDLEDIAEATRNGRKSGKRYSLIVIAEGVGDAQEFADEFSQLVPDQDVRALTLAHTQRGGKPTVRDRVFATMLGSKAVDMLVEGQNGVYLGINNDSVSVFDLTDDFAKVKPVFRSDLYELHLDLTGRKKA